MQEQPWLRHYAQGTPQHIDYPPISLVELLEETAAKHPLQNAVTLICARPMARTIERRSRMPG